MADWYRFYYDGVLQFDFEAEFCETAEEALSRAGDLVGDDLLEVVPLPERILSECVCSDNGEEREFRNLRQDYPGEWQCQSCGVIFCRPPDEIDWDVERMFDQGFSPCPICSSYDETCPYCHGSGWYRPKGIW